jgi:fibronectin-binding autotransporter adhesin
MQAATTLHRWTGAGNNGNWTTAANWLGNAAPSGGDQRLIFPAGAARKTNTNNLPAGRVFESIWITDSGYNIYGNGLNTSIVRRDDTVGTSTFRPDLTATATMTIQSELPGAKLVLAGDLIMGSFGVRVSGRGDVEIQGVISGTGGLQKTDGGELAFSGLGANTYTGSTLVRGGSLLLDRWTFRGGLTQVGTTAVPGDLSIGTGTSGTVSNWVVLSRDNQIANSSDVTVNSNGELQVNGNDDTIANLKLNEGRVTTGTGRLVLGAGALLSASAGSSTVFGRLDLGVGPQLTVDVEQGGSLHLEAQVSGAAGTALLKTNRGSLFLANSNLFSGPVEMSGGSLWVGHGHALGETNGVTRLKSGTIFLDAIGTTAEILHSVSPGGVLRVGNGSASWNGPVILEDDLFFYTPPNWALNVFGPITGPRGFSKLGEGVLQFKTTLTNDFAGPARITEGRLILDGVFHQPVISGPLIIGGTNHPPGSEVVSAIKNNQIRDDVPVRINSSGLLSLGGTSDTLGPITLAGGEIQTADAGLLTLGDNMLVEPSEERAILSGRLALGTASRQIQVLAGPPTVECEISAVVLGAGGVDLIKTGDGVLELSGSNTYAGRTLIHKGQLRATHDTALGSLAGETRVETGGRLALAGGVAVAESLKLNGNGGGPVSGCLANIEQTNRLTGSITLESDVTIAVYGSVGSLTLAGEISGPGGLTKVGPKPLVFAGSQVNSFEGTTRVTQGLLRLAKPNGIVGIAHDLVIGDGSAVPLQVVVDTTNSGQIRKDVAVVLDASGWLDLSQGATPIGSLEGDGLVTLGGTALTLGGNNLSRTFSGILSNAPAANGMTKVGSGIQVFTANNPFHNSMQVSGGGMVLHGQQPDTFVVVSSGGFVGGNGLVRQVQALSGGAVHPGASPGRLTILDSLQLSSSFLQIELNGTTPGTEYDQLQVQGSVALGGKLLLSFGYMPALNDTFRVINKTSPGPAAGEFGGLSEGEVIVVDGYSLRLTYVGGDGNDVELTRIPGAASSFDGIQLVSAGQVELTGAGVPGGHYVIEATSLLQPPILWTPVATNVASQSGAIHFTDAEVSSFPKRFFRMREK